MTPAVAPVDILASGSMSWAQAAEFSGVCQTMLRKAVRDGEIQTFVVGIRHRLIVKRSLVEWLARHYERSNKT